MMRMPFTVPIETPVGKITVANHPDPNHPGIWIRVNGQDLVLVEFDAEKGTHFAHIWTKKRDEEGDDPVSKIDLETRD